MYKGSLFEYSSYFRQKGTLESEVEVKVKRLGSLHREGAVQTLLETLQWRAITRAPSLGPGLSSP